MELFRSVFMFFKLGKSFRCTLRLLIMGEEETSLSEYLFDIQSEANLEPLILFAAQYSFRSKSLGVN